MRKSLTFALVAATFALAPAGAQAQQKIKVAYLRAAMMIQHWHAEKKGYLKAEGIETDIVTVNNGPAVAAAVASGSVDIGWSGSVPIITARAQNQPFKVFSTNYSERFNPPRYETFIIASERSGIKTLADLKGHTFAMNAVGAVCELQLLEHLATVGLKLSDIKTIVVPFPQFQAAMELGNADASCPIEPFVTAMRLGGKIKPVTLAQGTIAGMDKLGPVAINAYFSTASWIDKNSKVAAGFLRALDRANKDLLKDLPTYRKYLVEEFKMPQAMADAVGVSLNPDPLYARPAEWQPLIDAMVKHKMIDKPMNAADLIYELTY